MAQIKLRCKKLINREQCILSENHKGKCKKHWITQKELNKRLEACGYGCSMYPNNWWSKKQLEKTERLGKIFKQLEKEMGRKLTPEEFSGLTKGDKLFSTHDLRMYSELLFKEGNLGEIEQIRYGRKMTKKLPVGNYYLEAMTDPNCEFLLVFMRAGMTIKELKKHIKIDDKYLAKKLQLLLDAKLLKKKLVEEYSATEEGETAMGEYGW